MNVFSSVTNYLRGSSKSRKSKDAGPDAAAKRQRADPYGVGGPYKGGPGGSPAPSSQADDSSSGTSVTTDADRPSSREAGGSPTGQPMDPRQLEKRQAEEKDFIRVHDSAEAPIWYLIDVQWLQAWKYFVTRGGQVPGPIDNNRLVDRQTGIPKRGLQAVTDYRGVNGEIWNFWLRRYGGGPVIRRKHLDLYAQEVEEPSADRRGVSGGYKEIPLPGAGDSGRRGLGLQASSMHSRDGGDEGSDGSSAGTSPPAGSPGGGSSAASPAVQQSSRRPGIFSIGSRSSTSAVRNSQASTAAASPQAPGRRPGDVAGKALCCDKCDGPHETEKCPHFRKGREKHNDAWSSYGKVNKGKEDPDGDGAPIVRNAKVVEQPADGSCLFHSLSYGLGDKSTASTLRRDICGYLAENPDMTIADTAIAEWIRYDSNDTVVQYAQRMRGGVWGGGIEMAALTKMKNVNVHVYEKCREGYRRISAFESPGARKTVSVLYQGRMHYDAIVV